MYVISKLFGSIWLSPRHAMEILCFFLLCFVGPMLFPPPRFGVNSVTVQDLPLHQHSPLFSILLSEYVITVVINSSLNMFFSYKLTLFIFLFNKFIFKILVFINLYFLILVFYLFLIFISLRFFYFTFYKCQLTKIINEKKSKLKNTNLHQKNKT